MDMKHSILIFIMSVLFSVAIAGCKNGGDKKILNKENSMDLVSDRIEHTHSRCRIFDVETKSDELSVINSLERRGVVKVDSIKLSNGKFQFAIIEFAGVKFGMNKGFVFITSRHDEKTINLLVNEISKYYGDPEIDEEDDEPESGYYHWNMNNENSDDPYIRIRPLHSADGGLTMLWQFHLL